MNKIRTLETYYIRPSRTIETILISNEDLNVVLFMYNYEGYSFRLFYSILDLCFFINDKKSSFSHFDTEEELDDFLVNINLPINSCFIKEVI